MEADQGSQIKELIGYFKNPSIKVQLEALTIALQLSTTPLDRKLFENSEIIKQILRLFTTRVLHIQWPYY